MKRIYGFLNGLCRENSRRYLLGLQTAAWVTICTTVFGRITTGWLLSAIAVIGIILWKRAQSNLTGVRFDLEDAGVILAGAANVWLWMLLIFLVR